MRHSLHPWPGVALWAAFSPLLGQCGSNDRRAVSGPNSGEAGPLDLGSPESGLSFGGGGAGGEGGIQPETVTILGPGVTPSDRDLLDNAAPVPDAAPRIDY